MAENWKCSKCGGINPGKRETCIGCNTPKLGSNAPADPVEPPAAPIEYVCDVCRHTSINGDKGVVVTADAEEQWRGGSKYKQYSNFHRMRIFICSNCRKEKGSVEKAIVNKAATFGRTGEFSYWDNFDYSTIWHGDQPYIIIKDAMKDELYDNIENRNVEIIINYPGESLMANKSYFVLIDDVPVALISIAKEYRISLNVTPGMHRIKTAITGVKEVLINAEPNKAYEFNGKFDRWMGGVKLTPR
jgi:hypothetical protein